MKTLEDYQNGQMLLIDKPLKWTSFQVVNKIRWHISRHFNIKKIKVGHAGTLDPLATGLLIICTGKMTKRIDEFQAQKKTYTGKITLGSTTPSFDLETEVDQTYPTEHLTPSLIKSKAKDFTGDIMQVPPMYSAVKKDGKRLYKMAREGVNVEIKSRKVNIEKFEILRIDDLEIEFLVVCSKGTYIRSLAHDFGQALGTGAHLSALRRTGIGDFDVKNAMNIDDFIQTLKG